MEQTNILIVDDERGVLSSLKRELADEPYNVLCAGGGNEALKILSENPCKVIVTDVKMPGMDGFELLAGIKESYPGVIRVVLSGHSDVRLILDIVNKGGIDRYLTKPWDIADVKATIRQCIELFDLRQEVYELRKMIKQQGRPDNGG
ncbi:MAG: response regulator [Nitrospiraceae bacterium]|nr:MAG: response regulator [Nitrospiraceae bacterium]